jgi:hypothetical protein
MTNNLLIDQQKAHDAVSKAKALFDEAKKHEDDAQTALEDANKQEADAKKKYADVEAGFPCHLPCNIHPLQYSLVYVFVHHPCNTH